MEVDSKELLVPSFILLIHSLIFNCWTLDGLFVAKDDRSWLNLVIWPEVLHFKHWYWDPSIFNRLVAKRFKTFHWRKLIFCYFLLQTAWIRSDDRALSAKRTIPLFVYDSSRFVCWILMFRSSCIVYSDDTLLQNPVQLLIFMRTGTRKIIVNISLSRNSCPLNSRKLFWITSTSARSRPWKPRSFGMTQYESEWLQIKRMQNKPL